MKIKKEEKRRISNISKSLEDKQSKTEGKTREEITYRMLDGENEKNKMTSQKDVRYKVKI